MVEFIRMNNLPSEKKVYGGLYEIVVLLRVFFPLIIFKYPLMGFIGSFLLDGIDGEFAGHKIMSHRHYEIVDKILDFWWYAIIFLYVFVNLPQYIYLMAPFLIFRFVGDILFLIKRVRKYLFYFPNFYENIFILIFLGTYFPKLNFLINKSNFYLWLIIAFILKIVQEYWLHIINGWISDRVFHLKKKWLKKDKWE